MRFLNPLDEHIETTLCLGLRCMPLFFRILKLIYHRDDDGLYSIAFSNKKSCYTWIYTGYPRYLRVTTNHIRSAKHIIFLFWPLSGQQIRGVLRSWSATFTHNFDAHCSAILRT